jgi:hypothetical protein
LHNFANTTYFLKDYADRLCRAIGYSPAVRRVGERLIVNRFYNVLSDHSFGMLL